LSLEERLKGLSAEQLKAFLERLQQDNSSATE
jgi:hypothetical protein